MIEAGMTVGREVVDAMRSARAGVPDRAVRDDARALDSEHRRALALHEKVVRTHQRRLARRHQRATTFTAVAGVTGTLGVVDVLTSTLTDGGVVPGSAWMWLTATAVSAVVAVRARLSLRRTPPARFGPPPPAPPPLLPPGARGHLEAARLMRVRVQLAQIVPAVSGLHPDAGEELRRADAEAAPALNALVQRLLVLAGIERDLPGTAAAGAAATAAEEVRARLAAGVDTYERLIAAAASMLAAPDLGRSSEAVLGPAIDALAAYTGGLSASADAFGP
jgi:hypothetical protein